MNEKLIVCLGNFKDKYPYKLEERYGRIVERIVQLWGSPDIDAYFTDLMIDKRGGRQGFAEDVAREIILLSLIYDKIHAKQSESGGDVWGDERDDPKRR